MGIHQKLLMIQKELNAPKSHYNSFGKYNYRNCEDILEALKPLCDKNKAVVTISDEIAQIGDRFYVKAATVLTDIETGETVGATAYAREETDKKGMDGSQITGAASSYARKYALNGLFAIDDTKDADGDEGGDEQNNSPKKPKPKETEKPKYNQEQNQYNILKLIKDTKVTAETVKQLIAKKFGNRKANELNETQYNELIEDIEVLLNEA